MTLELRPDGVTLERFLLSPARVRAIQGPRGSGKSTTSYMALVLAAQDQPPCADGIVRVRYYVVRNTYDQLKRTTVETCKAVLPVDQFGEMSGDRPIQRIVRMGNIEMELLFVSIDDVKDLAKLLSVDCSGIYLNEFRELHRKLIDECDALVGRYPSKLMVPPDPETGFEGGCKRPLVILDTNPPSETHWWAKMSGQVLIPPETSEEERRTLTLPPTWEIFIQPPAMIEIKNRDGEVEGYEMNPAAENLRWLPGGAAYYKNMIWAKTRAWLAVNVLNRCGSEQEGRPVWPEFQREFHVARAPLTAVSGHPICVGVDFGRTPAAIFGQRVFNRWRILGELIGKNVGARQFARLVRAELVAKFPKFDFALFGDPAGDDMEQSDEISPFLMFRAEGLHVVAAPTNDPSVRVEAVAELLRQVEEGKPRLEVSPGCVTLIASMEGGYHFRRIGRGGGDDRYSDVPMKDAYSHPADALQYLVLGQGEGRVVLGRSREAPTGRPRAAKARKTAFDRRRAG